MSFLDRVIDSGVGLEILGEPVASRSQAGVHYLVDGICVTCRSTASRNFNPSLHPHDPHDGKFVHTGGGLGSFAGKLADALKGADALDAAPVGLVTDHQAGGITISGIDDREAMLAVLSYQMGMHDSVNGVLRGGNVPGNRARAEAGIAKIDAAMGQSPLSHDVQAFRGIRNGRRLGDAWDGDMTGVEFTELAYASTTTDRRVADDFMGDRDPAPAVLHILVPKGTHALKLSDFGEGHNDEAELLLDRGLHFRVVGDRTENGRRILDVEVIQ